MNSEQKKTLLLVMSLVLHLHDLDEDEQRILAAKADELEGHTELAWITEFINENPATAIERGRVFVNTLTGNSPKDFRILCIRETLSAVQEKGYLSESEAVAVLKFARDWRIEPELKAMVS